MSPPKPVESPPTTPAHPTPASARPTPRPRPQSPLHRAKYRLHQLASPQPCYHFATRTAKYFAALAALLLIAGSIGGLLLAPPDYQMGDSYRILYIHAPAAWMSMLTYLLMALAAALGLIWRIKLGDALARACAPLGAMFTACALITGALWGKPTWGAYWVWDARLTSELVLLFLFLGYIALANAIEDRRTATRAAAIIALAGVINLPIIHYSVEWWNTLHQPATISSLSKLRDPAIEPAMLIPLLIMFLAFKLYFIACLLNRLRYELLASERRTQWVQKLLHA